MLEQSRPPTIVVTHPIHDTAIAKITAAGYGVTVLPGQTPLTAKDLIPRLDGCEAVVCHLVDRIDEQVLAHPGLRVVATVSAGLDHIDLEAARRHDVRIVNTPGVLTEATADFTIALMLAVARRIPESDAHVRSGRFDGWKLMDELIGADVTGATLGIVGMGRIGQAVAQRARAAFDMTIIYHSTTAKSDLPGHLDARWVPLPELLATSDFVSLHAPLTPDTHHLIGAHALQTMQPHAFLINTSRGALVDEAALAQALADGSIAGAALDVFENEPHVHPGLLERTERVVLAAHAGSATARTRERMSLLAVDGLLRELGAATR